jgi:hypothetical protein
MDESIQGTAVSFWSFLVNFLASNRRHLREKVLIHLFFNLRQRHSLAFGYKWMRKFWKLAGARSQSYEGFWGCLSGCQVP